MIWSMVSLHRNVDDLDRTIDKINEQTESMKQIQDALSAPADFDEVIRLFRVESG